MSFDFAGFERMLMSVLTNDNQARHEAEKHYLSVIKHQPDQTLQALVHMLRFSQGISVCFCKFPSGAKRQGPPG